MRIAPLACSLILFSLQPNLESARPTSTSVKVRKNETAAAIARRHGLSLTQLAALNPERDLDKLSVGARLRVKSTERAAKARPVEVEPLAPLPSIPAVPPMPMARLERVLPLGVGEAPDTLTPKAVQADSPRALAGYIQPVLAGQPAPEPTANTPAPLGFEPADPNHLDLLWPVETRTVSSGYGPRMRSSTRLVAAKGGKKSRRIRVPYQGAHRGVDLNAPKGTDVFAALDGRVVEVGKQKQMGNFVVIDHGNGVQTLYGHNHRHFVQEGDLVRRGQKIAEVGRTGRATGPHVHFELHIDGVRHNPAPFLNDVEQIPEEILAQNSAAVPPSRR